MDLTLLSFAITFERSFCFHWILYLLFNLYRQNSYQRPPLLNRHLYNQLFMNLNVNLNSKFTCDGQYMYLPSKAMLRCSLTGWIRQVSQFHNKLVPSQKENKNKHTTQSRVFRISLLSHCAQYTHTHESTRTTIRACKN